MEASTPVTSNESENIDQLSKPTPSENPQGGTPQYEHDTKDGTTDGKEHNREYPSNMQKALILGPVTMTYFLWFLDLAVVSTATPTITAQFDSLVDIGWYGGAYQLGASAVQPLTGKIFQKFSTKWTFLVYFLIFLFGSVLCGAAQSSNMLIIGRAVAGVGSAGIGNGALTIISAVMPVRARARFLGINQGIGQLGLALGPILGGIFTEYVSWRWCFYINLPVGGVVAILLLFTKIPEPETKLPARQILATAVKSLDLPGFMLICPAVVMILLGMQYGGNQYAWNSSVVIGLLVGGAITLMLFLIWERRQGDEAMVPFSMLKTRIIWSAAGNMFFVLSAILVADYYLAIYFQAVHDDTPFLSGVHLLPTTIGMVLFTMISGVMIEKLGYYLPWVVTGTAVTCIGYGLLSTLGPHTPAPKWIGFQTFYGVGNGCMAASAYIAVQNLVPTAQIPIAMAIVIFCQGMGGAVSLVAANAIFSNTLKKQLTQRAAEIKVNPEIIVNAGVRGFRKLVHGQELAAVLQAYAKSIDTVMYFGIGVSVAAFAFAWGLGFKDIREEKDLDGIRSDEKEEKTSPVPETV